MKIMKTRIAAIAAIAASTVLAACGGGGDSAAPPSAGPTAEGFWSGTATTGVAVALAILENGEAWGIYTSGGSIVGALYGNTSFSGTTLTGSGLDFNIPSRTIFPATYSGSFAPQSTISVTTSGGVTFNGVYDRAYEQPASLAAVAGAFSGQGVSGNSTVQSIPLSIASNGTVTVPGTTGCSANGTLTPRPTGKNIFNVSVTFTGTNCALGNGTVTTGIGYYNTITQGLLVLAMNPAKTDGFIYVGRK